MNAAIYDFAAIAKLTKAFPEDRPQNVIDPPKPEPESPPYSYSSGDLSDQPDYGMFAGFPSMEANWRSSADLFASVLIPWEPMEVVTSFDLESSGGIIPLVTWDDNGFVSVEFEDGEP